MKLYARWLRFWHCLFHLHRAVTLHRRGRVIYIGCECYRFWYVVDHRLMTTGDLNAILDQLLTLASRRSFARSVDRRA